MKYDNANIDAFFDRDLLNKPRNDLTYVSFVMMIWTPSLFSVRDTVGGGAHGSATLSYPLTTCWIHSRLCSAPYSLALSVFLPSQLGMHY